MIEYYEEIFLLFMIIVFGSGYLIHKPKFDKYFKKKFSDDKLSLNILEVEITEIIEDGIYKKVHITTMANNICHVLKKCYEVDVENINRNDKPWIG